MSLIEISSMSSIINYSINGFMEVNYSIYVGCIIIMTTIIALLVLNFLLEKYKKTSFMSLLMGVVYLFSLVTLFVRISKEFKTEINLFKFNDYCDISSYKN